MIVTRINTIKITFPHEHFLQMGALINHALQERSFMPCEFYSSVSIMVSVFNKFFYKNRVARKKYTLVLEYHEAEVLYYFFRSEILGLDPYTAMVFRTSADKLHLLLSEYKM